MIFDSKGDEVPQMRKQIGFMEKWTRMENDPIGVQGGQFISPKDMPKNQEQCLDGPWCRRPR